ncbi:MAG: hypothetical protein HOQ22_14845 [Nocardioidaceae bacterium]|nr:hypothetical protein [Nocardioidaceae bacterium]NUS52304.1 hypothetical protein [Nocardioidaceae bacterium]
MLGPLPRLHRWIVLGVVTASFVALGLWAAFLVPRVPALGLAGASAGATVGALLAHLILHRPAAHPRAAVRRGGRAAH